MLRSLFICTVFPRDSLLGCCVFCNSVAPLFYSFYIYKTAHNSILSVAQNSAVRPHYYMLVIWILSWKSGFFFCSSYSVLTIYLFLLLLSRPQEATPPTGKKLKRYRIRSPSLSWLAPAFCWTAWQPVFRFTHSLAEAGTAHDNTPHTQTLTQCWRHLINTHVSKIVPSVQTRTSPFSELHGIPRMKEAHHSPTNEHLHCA